MIREGRLLMFRHRDHPEAGLQVPAGTLHDGERPEDGVIRETEEETGRRGFTLVRKVGVYDHRHENGELHERHVFVLAPPPGLPETWSHLAEEGNGDFWFVYEWISFDRAVRELAGAQGTYLAEL
ncbi:MAG: NUDIX domain-containing protein [Chloroflexi bacterium]|nr:NUDIX domain-containing protein [Chloroflexota bacterium]